MKLTLNFLVCMGLMLTVTACGDDDPVIPRDRDVTMTVDALVHTLNADGEASISLGDKNTFVYHPKTQTTDMKITLGAQTFNLQQVPVTPVAYIDNRYEFNSATTSNPDVTNLNGIIDLSGSIAILQCDISSKHVCITIPDIFFEQNSVNMDYTDGSTSHDGNSFWTFSIDKTGNTAKISINNIEIAKDIMIQDGKRTRIGRYFAGIIGEGANVTPTATGITITAESLNTKASYGNGQEVNDAFKTEDYPIYNLQVNINLTTGKLQGNMVLRHVLTRDEQKIPTEWDDINMTVSGNIFKQLLFN